MLKLADRLNIEFTDIYDYTVEIENGYNQIFKEVRELCGKVKHKEAYALLKSSVNFDKIDTIYDKKLYYYFMGITSLMGQENPSDAIYYFNLVLTSEIETSLDFLDVSATNGVGIAYFMQEENEKALTYFEKSLEQLDELFTLIDTINDSPEIAKIYYNTSKFYSKMGDYNKAVNLSSLGIKLLKNEALGYYLDLLLYEKAFNLMKLGKKEESEKFYLYALVVADLNDNEFAVETIKRNFKDYSIGEYKYC